jgi:hypothetical protein
MTEQQVIEGTWEEIAQHAGELARSGKRLKLIIPADELPGGERFRGTARWTRLLWHVQR